MKLETLGANVTILHLDNGRIQTMGNCIVQAIGFSYDTPVCAFVTGKGFLKTDKKWSRTTSKHINMIHASLGGTISERPQEFFDSLL